MIGGAPYGHSAVVRAILAAELPGPGRPGAGPGRGSTGSPPLAGSLDDAHDPRGYDRESRRWAGGLSNGPSGRMR
jgi:hypothetical protein